MKKICLITIILLVLCTALTACDNKTNAKQTEIINITTVEDLKAIKNYLGDAYSLYTFELKNDLDLSGENWVPIGDSSEKSFRGTLNGNGYTISNLKIEGMSGETFTQSIPYQDTGLFGYIYNAKINDLTLSNINISFFVENDYAHIGGLAGFAFGDNTIRNITVSGAINLGTTFYYEQGLVLMDIACNQTQYIGGVIGYSTGSLELETINASAVINNFVASKGPQFDQVTESYIYEKDSAGSDTDTIATTVVTVKGENKYYPANVFAGSVIGLARGKGTIINNVASTGNLPTVYADSAYLGGIIGAAYQTKITSSTYSGSLGTKIYTKGVSGGIAGLLDESNMANVTVSDTRIIAAATKTVYQAYSIGGLAGYVNDFSVIQSSEVNNCEVISNLSNIMDEITKNYPVIGGFAGTIRDSDILDCEAVNGGVYKDKAKTNIDGNYIYSAGMVAFVNGNSAVKGCYSSFKAYTGAIAKYIENIYVDSKGERILRYIKRENPKVFVGVKAYVDSNVLKCKIFDEAGDEIGEFSYSEFVGTDKESYAQNYYDGNTYTLENAEGLFMVIGERTLIDYEPLTGMYTFEDLKYLKSAYIEEDLNDEDMGEGVYNFII